jgi:hypothetical protein
MNAYIQAIKWMVTHPDALWHIRGVQFLYPGASIHITEPENPEMSLGHFCYTKTKWSIFKRQYSMSKVLEGLKKAAEDTDSTCNYIPIYNPDVARISGKGGCLTGVSVMQSPKKGTHINVDFRATEFTWRHSVDFMAFTRLLQLVPELPRPVTLHFNYNKLYLNTLFLPMLDVPLGKKVHKELREMAYPRIAKAWKQYYRQFRDKKDPYVCKMKSIERAVEWTRGDRTPDIIPWDQMII